MRKIVMIVLLLLLTGCSEESKGVNLPSGETITISVNDNISLNTTEGLDIEFTVNSSDKDSHSIVVLAGYYKFTVIGEGFDYFNYGIDSSYLILPTEDIDNYLQSHKNTLEITKGKGIYTYEVFSELGVSKGVYEVVVELHILTSEGVYMLPFEMEVEIT